MTLLAHFVKRERIDQIAQMNNGTPPAKSTLKKPTYFIEVLDEEEDGNHFISAFDFHHAYRWHCEDPDCRIVERV